MSGRKVHLWCLQVCCDAPRFGLGNVPVVLQPNHCGWDQVASVEGVQVGTAQLVREIGSVVLKHVEHELARTPIGVIGAV
jgi:hypothetical protein